MIGVLHFVAAWGSTSHTKTVFPGGAMYSSSSTAGGGRSRVNVSTRLRSARPQPARDKDKIFLGFPQKRAT